MDNSESNIDLNQILVALQHFQQENATLRDSVHRMQDQSQPPAPVPAALAMVAPEPKISLPEKFDGTCPKFRGFVSQVHLIIQLHPHRYLDDTTRVGFIGTLRIGTIAAWFAPILETSSPFLQDFDAFMAEFEALFGDSDKARTSANKLRRLQQGTCSAIVYASEFRQLACDVNWGEVALIDQFHYGLRDDVQDLLLTLADPSSFSETITQVIRCDNCQFERHEEKKVTSNAQLWNSCPTTLPLIPQTTTVARPSSFGLAPMQIDAAKFKPLTKAEKFCRRTNNLCFYCGNPGHIARQCPQKLIKLQVQVVETPQELENKNIQSQ
jgi:hypothetical protein